MTLSLPSSTIPQLWGRPPLPPKWRSRKHFGFRLQAVILSVFLVSFFLEVLPLAAQAPPAASTPLNPSPSARPPDGFTLTLQATDIEYLGTDSGGKVSWSSQIGGTTNATRVGYEAGGAAGEARFELLPARMPSAAIAGTTQAGVWLKASSFGAPRIRVYDPAWSASYVGELGIAAPQVSENDAAWLNSRLPRVLNFTNATCPISPFQVECATVAWKQAGDGGLKSLTLVLRLRKDDPGFRWTTLNGYPYPAPAPKKVEKQSPPPKPLGEEPEEPRREFLRQSTVLLKPGEFEIEIMLGYERSEEKNVEQLADGTISTEFHRIRDLSIPLSLRAGVFENAEAFLQLPLKHVEFEHEHADLRFHETQSLTGIGDVSVGMKYLLFPEDADRPDIILALTIVAPTGKDTYEVNQHEAALGSGHWMFSPGVSFVKSYDPVVVFGGIEYAHFLSREALGDTVQPGERFGYDFGVAFAVNSNITLSQQFLGAFQTESRVSGERIVGSAREPISLRLALTNRLSRRGFLEPSVTFGLTDDASNFHIAIAYTWGF